MSNRYFVETEPTIAICPFRINQCNMFMPDACVIKHDASLEKDTRKWLRITARANICPHLGIQLIREQWQAHKIGKI